MAAPLSDVFVLRLTESQTYGLFFLLGSFAVATLSDLRRLSAQREFLEVWVLFVLVTLGLDLWQLGGRPTMLFWVKWGLLALLCVISWERVGLVFRLAPADVTACAALGSLLSPGFILLFWAVLRVTAWVEVPVLPKKGGAYPFLPVVSTATLVVLAFGKLVLPRLG